MKISIIAAIGKNRELGKNNDIPWHIPEDFKRFKQITSGHSVIMGRKTWESLPIRPLPKRYNIVITRDLGFKIEGMMKGDNFRIANSLEEAIKIASSKQGNDEIFIIGGGQIFEQALPLVNKLYLTVVDGDFDADTFFPDYSEFKKVVFEKESSEGELRYKFLELEK